ncbi:MAG: hypothetical protein K2V38_20715 [Gemmataceae bacterium]|nr:hypothetical protein [Gemmataceae bacterium]
MWAAPLFAAEDPLNRPELIYGIAGLCAALLAGAVAIAVVDRWRKKANAPAQAEQTDMLNVYRDAFEQGDLTAAEYAELRQKVADKVKTAPAPPAPAANQGPAGRPDLSKFLPPAHPPAPDDPPARPSSALGPDYNPAADPPPQQAPPAEPPGPPAPS